MMFYIIILIKMIVHNLQITKKSLDEAHRKAEILDQVIDWRITEVQAWIELWVTDRWIRNLLKSYKRHWEQWLIHWLVGKQSNHHIKDTDEKIVVDMIKQDDFKDCKPIFINEKLDEIYDIHISKETVRNIMIREKIWLKGTKKHHVYRMKRPRKDFYWEMDQFDGSYHKRLEDRGEESCLLLDIDDATGEINHAKLAENEWYECVVDFWKENIKRHGIPRSIYLDKFSTYKVTYSKAKNIKEVRTHFDRAMQELGCNLISANSPEAKWRVEKCNWTLQDRLVKELRLAKISTIEKANEFIANVFIPKYNKQFAIDAKKTGDIHIIPTKEQLDNLDRIFARKQLRSLARDYIIQYKNRFFQIEESKWYSVYPKKLLLVMETIDSKLHIHAWKSSDDKLVIFREISDIDVKRSRAIYWNQKHKIEKERLKQAIIERKKEKHRISKQKQIHRKAQSLFDKLQ